MTEKRVINALDSDVPLPYQELNEKIRKAIQDGEKHIVIKNCLGQRFIGAGIKETVKIDIEGIPGNDLGMFMDGPEIEVYGNAQDQTGNTMNSGKIVIHGNAWDVTGLSMRGGNVFVKGDGGYRIGIHMKEYQDKIPTLIYGGKVKEFFGEYMGGGILAVLGLKIDNGEVENIPSNELIGGLLGSGIHGGKIYIRGDVDKRMLGIGAGIQEFDKDDEKVLKPIFKEFAEHFNIPESMIWEREITKVIPASHRPFAAYYCKGNICIE